MQITITGARGSGTTTIAGIIYKLLSGAGQDVRVTCPSILEARAIMDTKGSPSDVMPSVAAIHLIVGIDSEDEAAIKTRSKVDG